MVRGQRGWNEVQKEEGFGHGKVVVRVVVEMGSPRRKLGTDSRANGRVVRFSRTNHNSSSQPVRCCTVDTKLYKERVQISTS